MAHVHDTHHGHGSTTIIDDREGPAMVLIVLVVVVALAMLVWFFAFSGVVIDRNPGPTTNIEQNNENPSDSGPGSNNIPTPGGTSG